MILLVRCAIAAVSKHSVKMNILVFGLKW